MGGEKEDFNLVSIKNSSREYSASKPIFDDNQEEKIQVHSFDQTNDFLQKINEVQQQILNGLQNQEKLSFSNQGEKSQVYNNNIQNQKLSISSNDPEMASLKKVIAMQKREIDQALYNLEHAKNTSIKLNDHANNRVKGLERETVAKSNAISALKKVILTQKNELEEQQKQIQILQKQKASKHILNINQGMQEKHDMIQNLHVITKELSTHYHNKISKYRTLLNKAQQQKEKALRIHKIGEEKTNEQIKLSQLELSKNKEMLDDFKKLLKNQEEEIQRREGLIEQLSKENNELKHAAAQAMHKSNMYEKISLKSKNDALGHFEEMNNALEELEIAQNESKIFKEKIPLLAQQIEKYKQQIDIVQAEYDKRIERIKQKHEVELKEFFKDQTRKEMELKTQNYALVKQLDEAEKEVAIQKQKQVEFANELKTRMSSLFTDYNKPIITNSPSEIKEDYELIDNE